MGKLVKASIWRVECFERGSRPSVARIGVWIKRGDLPGKIIGGTIYVDADEFVFGKHPDLAIETETVTPEQLLH